MDRNSVVTIPDPALRQRSQRVGVVNNEVRQLAQNMIEAALDWEKHRKNEVSAALAAVQVGQLIRVIIVRNTFDDKNDKSFLVLINPEIVKTEGEPELDSEGCLSVTDVYGVVPRYPKIKVKALDLQGKPVRLTATGFLARVIQHEVDHLHGKLFVDRVEDSEFYKLDDEGEFIKLEKKDYGKYHLLRK